MKTSSSSGDGKSHAAADFLSVGQAAQESEIPERTIRDLLKKGILPGQQDETNKQWRILRTDWQQYVHERTQRISNAATVSAPVRLLADEFELERVHNALQQALATNVQLTQTLDEVQKAYQHLQSDYTDVRLRLEMLRRQRRGCLLGWLEPLLSRWGRKHV